LSDTPLAKSVTERGGGGRKGRSSKKGEMKGATDQPASLLRTLSSRSATGVPIEKGRRRVVGKKRREGFLDRNLTTPPRRARALKEREEEKRKKKKKNCTGRKRRGERSWTRSAFGHPLPSYFRLTALSIFSLGWRGGGEGKVAQEGGKKEKKKGRGKRVQSLAARPRGVYITV